MVLLKPKIIIIIPKMDGVHMNHSCVTIHLNTSFPCFLLNPHRVKFVPAYKKDVIQ